LSESGAHSTYIGGYESLVTFKPVINTGLGGRRDAIERLLSLRIGPPSSIAIGYLGVFEGRGLSEFRWTVANHNDTSRWRSVYSSKRELERREVLERMAVRKRFLEDKSGVVCDGGSLRQLRPLAKFDATKGYPGEGPCSCRNRDGGGEIEIQGDQKCDAGKRCTISGHAHRRKAHEGAKRRLDEAKRKKGRAHKFVVCKMLLPELCQDDHVHGIGCSGPVHVCPGVEAAMDLENKELDDLFGDGEEVSPRTVQAMMQTTKTILPRLEVARPAPQTLNITKKVVTIAPAVDQLDDGGSPPESDCESEESEGSLASDLEEDVDAFEVAGVPVDPYYTEETDLFFTELGHLEQSLTLYQVLFWMSLIGPLFKLLTNLWIWCNLELRRPVSQFPRVVDVFLTREYTTNRHTNQALDNGSIGVKDIFSEYLPHRRRGEVYTHIAAAAMRDKRLMETVFVTNDMKLNPGSEREVMSYLTGLRFFGNLDPAFVDNTRQRISNLFIQRGLQNRMTYNSAIVAPLNRRTGPVGGLLATDPFIGLFPLSVRSTRIFILIILSWIGGTAVILSMGTYLLWVLTRYLLSILCTAACLALVSHTTGLYTLTQIRTSAAPFVALLQPGGI